MYRVWVFFACLFCSPPPPFSLLPPSSISTTLFFLPVIWNPAADPADANRIRPATTLTHFSFRSSSFCDRSPFSVVSFSLTFFSCSFVLHSPPLPPPPSLSQHPAFFSVSFLNDSPNFPGTAVDTKRVNSFNVHEGVLLLLLVCMT